MDGTSSYPSDAEQEQQQENVNPDGPQINIEGNPFTATPPQETHSQPHWNREPEHQNLPRQHPHQRMGESVSLHRFSVNYMKLYLKLISIVAKSTMIIIIEAPLVYKGAH